MLTLFENHLNIFRKIPNSLYCLYKLDLFLLIKFKNRTSSSSKLSSPYVFILSPPFFELKKSPVTNFLFLVSLKNNNFSNPLLV